MLTTFPSASPSDQPSCSKVDIYGNTFYGTVRNLCWKIEVKPGGRLIADNSNPGGIPCSAQNFIGTEEDVRSEFDSFIGDINTAYWSKGPYSLGGESRFVESDEVSDTRIELFEFLGEERFFTLITIPTCRVL